MAPLIRLQQDDVRPFRALAVTIHRFEEIINGREYRIEVSAISTDRWRAQLVRLPGGSSALMPFYGATPHDAARQLTDWLGRAHRAACKPSLHALRRWRS
jgi:hypothetical protein